MAYKIEQDKKKHFYVGVPLGILLQLFIMNLFPLQPFLSTGINLVALLAICYGFELFSLVTGKGHADNLDAVAGVLGGITGIGLFWCVDSLL